VSPYAYELDLPASIRIHRVQPVSLLDPVSEDLLQGQVMPPPPPVEVDGEEEYQVSSIEDSRMYRNQVQYLVRWTGMIPSHGNQRSLSMGYKQLESSMVDTHRRLDRWRMLSEDLEPKGGILSRRRKVRRYSGIMEGDSGWCRRNCVTEERRRWKTRRKRREGGGII
jgi:hypothetical protein